MELTHAEAIQHQLELIDALAQLEVAKAEIKRYEQLDQVNPGGLPGAKLREHRYELRHLEHTIDSRRQMLILLGLPPQAVDILIERHRQAHVAPGKRDDELGDQTAPLIDKLTIYAPLAQSPAESPPLYVVENLSVKPGQHVEVGAALCRLGDYRRLYIEGQAFERDLEAVRRAMTEQWGVTAAVEQTAADQRGGVTQTEQDLPIVFIDATIDTETRSASFYVELFNTLETPLETMRRPFADWRCRVGQRIEVRIPTQQFKQRLVIPAEAVAQDGLESYVFQVSGDTFVRRRVEIAWRDERKVVLAEGQSIGEGVRIAMSGAYQLQLSLKNRAAGPAQHTHHH
jgi:multidrug efflux pump subunit AcrA (membrane-fusion protein)